MEARHLMIAVVIALSFVPTSAFGQSLYGQRLASKDGKWLIPVASRVLGSSDDDHLRRGSINSWDISVSVGTPIMAAAPGVVEAAGCNLYESRQWPIMQGYGCAVQISHGNKISSQYGHCKQGSLFVKRGDQVTQDSVLCLAGLTGMTSFQHVHFTILRNGSPVRIDSVFDISQMQRCFLCNGTNDPKTPVNGVIGNNVTHTTTATQPTTVAGTRYAQLLRILAQYPPQAISMGIMGLLGLLVLVYWLGGKVERIAIVAGVSGMAGAAVIMWLFIPLAQPVQAGQHSAVSGGNSWKAAYAFMRRWEGGSNPPCVHDPVRTLKGITQGTYTAWRMSQGMGPADVCTSLTEQQAEAIYYQRYWIASGAEKLSTPVAIAHFDHAVNAGVGAAKGILAQCGDNIECYIKGRLADYRTKGNYATYGRAWTNRVNDLVKYLQKGQ